MPSRVVAEGWNALNPFGPRPAGAMVFYCLPAGLYVLWGAWKKRWRAFGAD